MRKRSKKILLFPGCVALYRFVDYEVAARKVLEALGLEVLSPGTALCCGAFLEGRHPHWMRYSAFILAEAARREAFVVTLCGGCANAFARTRQTLSADSGAGADLKDWLHSQGFEDRDPADSMHLLEFLTIRREELARGIVCSLPWRVAPVYPCQVFRPGPVMGFDDPLRPRSLDDLIRLAGAQVVEYPLKYSCCGASAEIDGPAVAHGLARARLDQLRAARARVLVTACGNCHRLLQKLQPLYAPGPFFPGLFIPQLLGLAMGMTPEALRLDRRVVRALGYDEAPQAIAVYDAAAAASSRQGPAPGRRRPASSGRSRRCTECGACRGVCPVERGGWPSLAAEMLDAKAGPGHCSNCWLCHEVCPEGVDVWRRRLETLARHPLSAARRESLEEVARSGFCLPIGEETNEYRVFSGLPPVGLPTLELLKLLEFSMADVSK